MLEVKLLSHVPELVDLLADLVAVEERVVEVLVVVVVVVVVDVVVVVADPSARGVGVSRASGAARGAVPGVSALRRPRIDRGTCLAIAAPALPG